jgi:hypothetical protein
MEREQKTADVAGAAKGAATKGAAEADGKAEQAFKGYVRDLEADGGGGDGLRRMYTVAVPIPGRTELMYLGKWYYQDVTQKQVQSYERHATTPNGWFEITKDQYERQHGATNERGKVTRKPHPEAWTYKVRGPGGTTVKLEPIHFLDETRRKDDKSYFLVDKTACDVELRLESPMATDCDAIIEALGEDGGVRVVARLHFPAGETRAQGSYALLPGEAMRIALDVPSGPTLIASAIVRTTSTSGEPVVSNMDRYGTETPTDADVQQALKSRREN